jgi:hypothetical protein
VIVKKISVFLFLAFVSLACAGCGYHRARLDNPLLANYHTIAIPYFKNKTFEPGAEKIFTDAFMREFIESRKLKIAGESQADVILYGTVRNLKEDSIAQSANDKTLEYLLFMTVDLRLEERTTGKVLWSRKGMRHVEDYSVFDNSEQSSENSKSNGRRHAEDNPEYHDYIQLSEAAKLKSIQKIAADLAERSHDSIMMGF